MARIESAAHSGEIDEPTRRRLKKEQFMRELEYIRKKRTPISMAHYEMIRKIGQGSFGEVFLVRHHADRCLYAMKKLQKKDMIYKRQVNHVWLERFVLASVGEHPLVVKMHYSFQDQNHLYFIMEYLHGGDMMTMLIRNDYLPEDWARFYIAELAVAIDALHRTGIIHRDIKPDNILFRKNGHICLSDFGLSKCLMQPPDRTRFAVSAAEYVNAPNYIEHIRRGDIDLPLDDRIKIWKALAKENAFSQVGTPNYIAPEVIQDHSYTESCDWWSVGVILFEMLVGYPPFCSRNPNHVTTMICQWRRYLRFPKELPESRLSHHAKDLICRLICEAPYRLGARRGLAEFREHPFFKGIDWDNLSKAQAPFIPELQSDTDTRYFEDDITSTVITHPGPHHSPHHNDHHDPAARYAAKAHGGHAPESGIGPRRRSVRPVKYDRNRDLEFVGFTFIPMRVPMDDNWGIKDLYNSPSLSRVEEKPSPITQALSLEVDPGVNKLKPLRSPRGPVAQAAIAAAEVTSDDPNEVQVVAQHDVVIKDTAERRECGHVRQSRVRFQEVPFVASAPESHQNRVIQFASDVSSCTSGEIRASNDVLSSELDSVSVPVSEAKQPQKDFDDIDSGLGAVPVHESPIPTAGEMWDGDSETEPLATSPVSNKPSLHSCLSLPELRSKDVGSGELKDDSDSEHRDKDRQGSSDTEGVTNSSLDEECSIIRRTSRLQDPSHVPVFSRAEEATEAVSPISSDSPTLPPSASEVDLFVVHASRAIDTAARELSNTPTGANVSAVVRHAKEDLTGTAQKLQESLVPVGSISTASEETSDFPQSPQEQGNVELEVPSDPVVVQSESMMV